MEVTAVADPNVCWGRFERLLGADLLVHGHSLMAFDESAEDNESHRFID
jgi:hypothetical protein